MMNELVVAAGGLRANQVDDICPQEISSVYAIMPPDMGREHDTFWAVGKIGRYGRLKVALMV